MVKTGSSFCALSSKCVRIGNYSVIPRGRILTTDSFLQMKVPRIVAGTKEEYVTLDLPLEDVVNVLAFFGSVKPVLFFFLSPGGCRKVRELLRMKSRHSLFLDNCAGQDDSQKRLTVLLEKVVKASCFDVLLGDLSRNCQDYSFQVEILAGNFVILYFHLHSIHGFIHR